MPTFSKANKLLRPSEFQYVFNDPVRITNRAFTVLVRKNQGNQPRLGLAIAKKHIPTAVSRNRIKRLVRESFRLNKETLPPFDFVFMVRRDSVSLDREKIRTNVQHIWIKTRTLCAI